MDKNLIIDADGKVIDESAFQKACSAWVYKNIGECVSSLMYDVGQNLEQCAEIFDFDYDEALGWFQVQDWETAVDDFIDGAGLDDLETIADKVGYWDDAIEECDVPEILELEDDGTVIWKTMDQFFDEEYEAIEAARSSVIDVIREKVKGLITNADEYREIGEEFNLDVGYDEVYEHWTCDRYTAGVLQEHGQIVFDFGGLRIWGRMTTGQSISMDYVIRQIVKGLESNHWVWNEAR